VHREYHRWYSPSLGRDMQLLVFGHAGARALVFPTSQGRFYEWEDRGMVSALADHLNNGWLQLICVDSVDAESWYNSRAHPADRARRHAQYDSYLLHEVMPLSWQINQTPFLITTGASFGAYHAAAFAFRYPHLVGRMIGMAGIYDIRRFTGGYSDDIVYVHNPAEFLVHEHDARRLDALRRMDIILTTGQDDQMRGESERLSTILWNKGIWNALRIWDGWAHDWPWWQRMFRMYVGGSD
jgi:esterase/lipase superfamily enzyme